MSKALRQIEERLSGLAPGTLRHETLQAAKQFKSSWIELGRALWTVSNQKAFREWGFLTFEAYCAKEVGIRAATAKKLLHSYYFLEKEEPTLLKELEGEAPSKLPSPEAVNVLRLIRKRKEISPERYQRFRSYALEEGKEAPVLRRELKSLMEETHPDPAALRASRRQAALRRMIGTLKSLQAESAASDFLPKSLTTQIGSLIKKLEEAL
ncbi:MAG: hypothetical protein HYS41_07190 [Candidatus Omnitrophica bacterium]|nr:hypothetical protein [Candidatus Omnitrophota bacterium]